MLRVQLKTTIILILSLPYLIRHAKNKLQVGQPSITLL